MKNSLSSASSTELARVLGISGRRIRQLAEAEILVRDEAGRFPLAASVGAYIGAVRSAAVARATVGGPADVLRERRAREIEHRLAREDRSLITLAEALASLDRITSDFLAAVDEVPARLGPNVPTGAEEVCLAVREELAQQFEAVRVKLESGAR